MRKSFLSAGAILAVVAFAGIAEAKPVNAADVATPGDREGFGCIVRAGESDAYQFDASCQSQRVIKRDRDGALMSYRYHDSGELQPGQTAPDRAVRLPVTATIGGLPCEGREIISPSGNYSSSIICR